MENSQSDDIIFTKNYKIALFISLLIAVEGLVMTVVNIIEHEMLLMFSTVSYSILMLISYFYVKKTKKLSFFFICSYIIVIYLEVTFLITGGSQGFGIIWMSLIPLFAMYCLDFKPFFILMAAIYFIMIVFFFTPIYNHIYQFTEKFKLRYTIYFFVDVALATFLKFRITKTEESLKLKEKLLSREIKEAGIIQSTFYKLKNKEFDDWIVAFRNIPMAIVSGDLYDLYSTEKKLDGFGIYDISGHGISSGLLTMLLKNITHQEFYSDNECDLWETVNRINDRFIEEKEEVSNYTTGIIVKTHENKLEIVNAAHPVPVIARENTNKIEFVEKDPTSRGPIGLQAFPAIYNSQFVTMESGDKIILYTDGIGDCKNENGDLYGDERFFEIIMNNTNISPEELINKIFDDLYSFTENASQTDDLTVMIVQRK